MNRILHTQNREIKGFEHEIDILHSFMTTTDKRINNVVKGLKENNIVINQLNNQFQNEYKTLEEKTSIIMSILTDQIYKSSELINSYSKVMNGIFNLLQKNYQQIYYPTKFYKTLYPIFKISSKLNDQDFSLCSKILTFICVVTISFFIDKIIRS